EWRTGCANAGDGSAGSLTRVGSFPGCASPSGLLDLSGNAWEWTADRLLKYDNPDVLLAPGRVIRGGAFDAKSDHATTTYRGVVPEGRGYEKTGFRCAMDVK
ncbi:MAG: formylglycine-generating enzyme family protein, partial [Blastocatellia bacterium]